MTLIAAGDNLRNRAMLGLQAMSQEEAEREALYQQMRQQEKAQAAQLAGTGAGIAGSAAVMNSDKIAAGLSNFFGGGGASGAAAAAPVGTSAVGSSISSLAGGGDAILSGGKLFLNASPVVESAAAQALNPLSAGALASPVGTTGTVAAGTGVAGGATAAGAGAGAGAAAGTGTAAGAGTAVGTGAGAAGSAGSLATIGTIAAPLAIGLGAFFLLNKLFD
jgi:hypothetical protein